MLTHPPELILTRPNFMLIRALSALTRRNTYSLPTSCSPYLPHAHPSLPHAHRPVEERRFSAALRHK
jgi:hypothetical protein